MSSAELTNKYYCSFHIYFVLMLFNLISWKLLNVCIILNLFLNILILFENKIIFLIDKIGLGWNIITIWKSYRNKMVLCI